MSRLRNLWQSIAIAVCLLYGLGFSLVALNRFWQYEVFYYDFGIFDSAISSVARFRPPIVDHLVIGGKPIFADHFSPSIFLLSPFFWFINKSEVLLIVQAASVALSGYILYVIGVRVLSRAFLAFSVMIAYLFFVGLQNALISDFHEVTVMTLPLMLTLWAVSEKKPVLYWIFFLITLGFKESSFLLGLGLACFILLTDRRAWKTAVATLAISLVWGITATQGIIPYFSGKPYAYSPEFPSTLGTFITSFFDNAVKRRTLLYSGLSFGFLPLLAPTVWPLIGLDLLTRFVPKATDLRWDLGLHYSAQMAVILGFGSVYGLKFLQKILPGTLLSALGIVLIGSSLYLHQFKLHGPLGLAYNPAFYRHTRDFVFLDQLLARVPEGALVMAQNNLAPHLTHTHTVLLLRDNYYSYAPEYIVIDNRAGQNPNDFFGVKNWPATFARLQSDPAYELIFATDEQFLFRRK